MKNLKNKKYKSVVILSPEAGVKISGASVESVVNARAKTKCYSAKRYLYGDFAYAQPLKMTMISCFALFFSLINISESKAECVGATETTAGTDNITGAHCGICGTNCNWKIEGATLKVTGGANGEIGSMINYGYQSAPWYSERSNISSIEISGIKRIGNFAFASMPYEKLTMTEDVKAIASASFAYNSHLKSVVIPTSASLGYGAFYHNKLEEIIVSDEITKEKIKNWNPSAFAYNPEGLKIICQGNIATCQAVMQKYVENTCSSLNFSNEEMRNFCIQGAKFQKADYKQCLSANYYWNGAECLREPDVTKRKCCSDVCKDMGGYCNRIRYTPAEAAQVLRDDNNNSVTITFRK